MILKESKSEIEMLVIYIFLLVLEMRIIMNIKINSFFIKKWWLKVIVFKIKWMKIVFGWFISFMLMLYDKMCLLV